MDRSIGNGVKGRAEAQKNKNRKGPKERIIYNSEKNSFSAVEGTET